ncbi:MAG: L-ribulose-5-phosphate 4-epimerase AraD [Phycisphaerales bacterium]
MSRVDEIEALRSEVCSANRMLATNALVTLTWGNVSGIDAARRHVAIKPSGVPYDELTPEAIVVIDLDGRVVAGSLRPSTDAPTHVALYRAFGEIGGVTHTHSTYATMFAQARRAIPCLGTTHADHWAGDVPVTRQLTADEVRTNYESATGAAIIECMRGRSPASSPGVLVAGHASFTWGRSALASLENAMALEAIARMAFGTLVLAPDAPALERHLIDKHHERKHGANAYYGQGRDGDRHGS